MSLRIVQDEQKILDAQAAIGVGKWVDVTDFSNIVLGIDTTDNANFTLYVVGAISESTPDPTQPQSPTNRWYTIQAIDNDANIAYDGSQGISASGTDIHKLFRINVDGLKWITVYVGDYTAGKITAYIKAFD